MIEIKNIRKSFGGVKALRDVNMKIGAGEIHAILGENGAGKSTLMKIISGAIPKDGGFITIDGRVVDFKNTLEAKKNGIGIIYQEFSLIPELSIAENIYLGHGRSNIIHWKKLNRDATALLNEIGFQLDVKKKVKALSVADQQIVEIAKALSDKVKILILDEPSAVLGPTEIHKLFATLRALKNNGVSIIYISHHLDELFELTDKISVLKDGETIGTLNTNETNKDELVELMLGRSLKTMFPKRGNAGVKKLHPRWFKIEGIQLSGNIEPLEIQINSGEIVGIGGLVGSGRTELLRAIFGADKQGSKTVWCNHEKVLATTPRQSIKAGIGMVPEDRKRHGGILGRPIRENISITNYGKVTNGLGFINSKRESTVVDGFKDRLNIRMGSMEMPLGALSGGNQQKVVLAKWLNIDADLLLIDEPTRGVDVGAKAEIYQIMVQLAEKGMAILMVSSDWEELMGLPDKVIIMRNGQIQGHVDRKDISEEKLLRLAMGEEKTKGITTI